MQPHSTLWKAALAVVSLCGCEAAVTTPAPPPLRGEAPVAPSAAPARTRAEVAAEAAEASTATEAARLRDLAKRARAECPYQGWGYLGDCAAYRAWRAEDHASEASLRVLLELLADANEENRMLGAVQEEWVRAGLRDPSRSPHLVALAQNEKKSFVAKAIGDAAGKLSEDVIEERRTIEALMAQPTLVDLRSEMVTKLYWAKDCPSDWLLSLSDGLQAEGASALPGLDLAGATERCEKDRDKLCTHLEQLLSKADTSAGFMTATQAVCPRLVARATEAVVAWAKHDLEQGGLGTLPMTLPDLCRSPVAAKDTQSKGLEAALILMKSKDNALRAIVVHAVDACDPKGTALKRLTRDPAPEVAKQATEAMQARQSAH